jgi:D-inositol-3-phosphate glycosyltransferase
MGSAQHESTGALRVAMVTGVLPVGGNVTGSPAHVHKTLRAVAGQGVSASLFEVDLRRARPLPLAAALARVARDLRRFRPHVLHAHGHIAAGAVFPLARWLRAPVVVEVHGLYVPSRSGQPGARACLSRLAEMAEIPILRRADHVIAQAAAMRDRLVEAGVRSDRIAVLYPGVRTAEFSDYRGPLPAVEGAALGDRMVVYVGSVHPYQGLDLLAAAQRRLPPGFRIVLVLSSDSGEPEDVATRFGFDPSRTTVVRPSSPDAIPGWCRRADVLVHARPDVPDNVNVQSKLGLYLASGRPVAATDVGDYRTLLGESRGCILARPDPADVARAIEEAVEPAVARAAAVDNPRLARRHFETEDNAARLAAIYRSLAEGAGGRRRDKLRS